MSPAKASSSSASKAAKKAEKAPHASVAKRHPQPASTSEYRDIGSSNIPEGSVKTKKPDGSDNTVQNVPHPSSLQRRSRRQKKKSSVLRKLIARCSFVYLVYATFWQCPSYANDKGAFGSDGPLLCAGINEVKADIRYLFSHPLYKQHIGQHVDPYLTQAQEHYTQHVAPLVSTSKYYGSKYGAPAAQKANGLYNQHVHPLYLKAHDHAKKQYDVHAKHHVDRYYTEAEQRYRKHVGPHVDYATTAAQKLQGDALKFHKEKVVPFNEAAGQRLQKTYLTTKPVVDKAIIQSIDFYHKKFQPAACAAFDTLWHLIKEIAYRIQVISVDAANKASVWSKDVYENHAQPYYQKKVAPLVAQKYQQYLEPSVIEAKKFIFAHVDKELVDQTWNTAKMNVDVVYRFVERHALLASAITVEFVQKQRERYEANRAKAAEAAKSVQYEASASASVAAAHISKMMTEQESSIKVAGAQATVVAGEMKGKAKGAAHHFATEAANMAKSAQDKVYGAAGNVYSQAKEGSSAAVSQFEKAKQAVASGLHHGVTEASNLGARGTAKVVDVAKSASTAASSVAQAPAITPLAGISSGKSSASQTTADTSSQPTVSVAPTNTPESVEEEDNAHVTNGKNGSKQGTQDGAQTIAAPFRDATKANVDNASAEQSTLSPINERQQEIVNDPKQDVTEELPVLEEAPIIPGEEEKIEEKFNVQGEAPVPLPVSENSSVDEDVQTVQGRVPIPIVEPEQPVLPIPVEQPKEAVVPTSDEQPEQAQSAEDTDSQIAGPVVPELQPKGDGDLSKLPPNDMGEHFDDSEFKQAPIRSEEKGYLDSIVTDQIEDIIKSADIIRTELEEKYDDIERAALENIQAGANAIEEESKSLVYQVIQTFQDFYQSQTADSTRSNEEKLVAIDEKYKATLKFLSDLLTDQRSISSQSARQAKSSVTAAQKSAEGQIRQRFKEGLHRLRSGTQEVSGLSERLHRELTTKLEDAQLQALKTVHSAEKVIAVEQKLLDAHTHRLTSKLDRLEATATGELNKWHQQAQQVFSMSEPLIDLESPSVDVDFEGFEIEHQPIPEETSPANVDDEENVTPVEPVVEHVQKDLQHQQIIDDHIRKAQERAARVAKTVEDWVEAAKRKSARTEAPSL
ncbi:hypothetical protein K450DRAFT_250083 [Umbelopsis ramanniana AG]|uniref:Uncharacterized protein n=1 Tax=Umbelopsis ramanniana AG TaxID=1314678 RepID=A0AAD5E7L8_UMBRA|nr:uncharacterized protein K450DRAFT_250083 [Umbelopsis ramanniana AG]KAI8577805.1 hypothetical protein K450DRAFT_250083 [Umbelopsis ramanniana AG]